MGVFNHYFIVEYSDCHRFSRLVVPFPLCTIFPTFKHIWLFIRVLLGCARFYIVYWFCYNERHDFDLTEADFLCILRLRGIVNYCCQTVGRT